jgi:hypothetical protein
MPAISPLFVYADVLVILAANRRRFSAQIATAWIIVSSRAFAYYIFYSKKHNRFRKDMRNDNPGQKKQRRMPMCLIYSAS